MDEMDGAIQPSFEVTECYVQDVNSVSPDIAGELYGPWHHDFPDLAALLESIEISESERATNVVPDPSAANGSPPVAAGAAYNTPAIEQPAGMPMVMYDAYGTDFTFVNEFGSSGAPMMSTPAQLPAGMLQAPVADDAGGYSFNQAPHALYQMLSDPAPMSPMSPMSSQMPPPIPPLPPMPPMTPMPPMSPISPLFSPPMSPMPLMPPMLAMRPQMPPPMPPMPRMSPMSPMPPQPPPIYFNRDGNGWADGAVCVNLQCRRN
ncbi:vegetative cell wall protein gp1-like [Anopheles arabiensis]|uniref:vegetative cell wall protein gp1-like n=1 Tax=Anopheles arabiensis TaxID=7173 RepID=UPI001AADFB91|nr:vegetative cell wall protein gp1-like [Anopheles arabiensis]